MTKKLNPSEKSVLKALLENPFKLSTTRVAKDANISWNTAEKYLKQFQEKVGLATAKEARKKAKTSGRQYFRSKQQDFSSKSLL